MGIRREMIVAAAVVIGVVGCGSWFLQRSNALQPAKAAPPTTLHRSAHSVTDPNSIWVIVNKKHSLQPETYAPADLQPIDNGQYLRAPAAQAETRLIRSAKQAGFTLTAASGYRSYDTQLEAYDSEVASYGTAVADKESARPGFSEHQTGLAVDLAGGGCDIQDCFGATTEGKWATANGYKYGFILRYTPANTAVTGYRGEAWHFRYVGIELATYMHNTSKSTLEEIFGVSGGDSY